MSDFVIVGGGVYGCAVAWELAKRGAEVTLLEANTVAGGASGGLGKRGVRANGRDGRELPLMQLAYERWPTLHEEIGADTGYDRQGHLLLIERPQDLAPAQAQLWLQNNYAIPSRLVEYGELHEMEPGLSERVQTAVFCPNDGIADHTATTRGLAAAAQKLGAVVREQTAVATLERQHGRITAVITHHGDRIPVGKAAILLSNHHAVTTLAQQFGLQLPIWTLLPQVMFTEKVDPMPLRHLIGHAHRVLAMKNHPTGQIMISGGWRGQWHDQLGRGETLPDQVAGNLAEAVAVYPALAGTAVAEADASRLETITLDGIPVIDHIPGVNNGFFATGWCGHGWAIAPAITPLLAAWVLTGEERSGLLRPFGYHRFQP